MIEVDRTKYQGKWFIWHRRWRGLGRPSRPKDD
jgi:hypothetical protein